MEAYIIKILLTAVGILLGVIVYFLKQLHAEFKSLSNAVIKMSAMTEVMQKTQENDRIAIHKRINDVASRLIRLEDKIFK